MAETRNKKKGLPIRGILMVIFGLIFVFSGYMVLSTELEGRQEQSAFGGSTAKSGTPFLGGWLRCGQRLRAGLWSQHENGTMFGSLDEEQYAEIVGWLTEQSLYDLGDAPENGEQIIILSTCSYHTDEGRFLVAAYRTA